MCTAKSAARKKRFTLGTLLPWLLTGIAFVYAFANIDATLFWLALKQYLSWKLLIALLLSAVIVLCNGLRKKLLLGKACPWSAATTAAFLCVGYNCLLPLKGGDIVHTVYLSRALGLSMGQVAHVLLWERFIDLHILLLLLVIFSAQLFTSSLPIVFMAVAMLLLWGILLCSTKFPDSFFRLVSHVPTKALKSFLRNFGEASRFCTFSWFLRLLWGTLLIWGGTLAFFVFSFTEIANLPITVFEAAYVGNLIIASSVIPSSPGSLGVFEAVSILALNIYGVDKNIALSIAIMSHTCLLFSPILGVVFILSTQKFRKVYL